MANAQGEPPVRRRQITISDLDAATELVRSRYADHRPSFFGDRESFLMRLTTTSVESAAGRLGVDRIRHSMGVYAPTEPASELLVVVPVAGHLRHTVGRETTSSVCLIPYWQACVTEWDTLDAVMGVLDLDGVRRVGAEMVGATPSEIEFTGWTPISPAWGDLVASTLAHLERHVLATEGAVSSPLIRGEAFRHFATTLLAAFPNTTHTLTAAVRNSGEPASVRRAIEFMDAHVREDIDVTRIAEAARIGTRGLQSAFRRHRGQTPLDYLRRARLDGAHRELCTGSPTEGDTVAGIAARWGFRHAGRFSVEYRQVYGRSPAQTLRE